MERNNERVIASPNYYRQRQQLAKHPFGTLKRQRGFTFTLMKGKEKVLGEVGLKFIGYNLTRCVSILGFVELCKALKKCAFVIKSIFLAPFLSLLEQLFLEDLKILNNRSPKLSPLYCAVNEI
jgi:hypothetical protein